MTITQRRLLGHSLVFAALAGAAPVAAWGAHQATSAAADVVLAVTTGVLVVAALFYLMVVGISTLVDRGVNRQFGKPEKPRQLTAREIHDRKVAELEDWLDADLARERAEFDRELAKATAPARRAATREQLDAEWEQALSAARDRFRYATPGPFKDAAMRQLAAMGRERVHQMTAQQTYVGTERSYS